MAKILIVDDDQDIVESLKVVLEDKGYKVVSAPDGSKGLKAVERENPDLIILDVMMESGDKGFDVAREIKENKKSAAIPILMLTAIEEKTGVSFKNEAGNENWLPVDDYAEKPIKPDDLIARVEKLLKKR
jgi:DNA-binding response OmpR family regulator